MRDLTEEAVRKKEWVILGVAIVAVLIAVHAGWPLLVILPLVLPLTMGRRGDG